MACTDKTRPYHYTQASITIQPIELCEKLGFNLGNAVKYICRAGAKPGESELDDLRKAAYYLAREHMLQHERSPYRTVFQKSVSWLMSLFIEKYPLLDGLELRNEEQATRYVLGKVRERISEIEYRIKVAQQDELEE